MNKNVKIAIIGAGTAGLSAFKEAAKYTKDILIIDKGPLGSTCARVGCMPSKTLIQAANYFYDRHHFAEQGIHGSEKLSVNVSEMLAYVRKMRDDFTEGVIEYTQSLGERFIHGDAQFIATDTLRVGKQIITAETIIIATGSRSIIPDEWQTLKEKILTSETIFEQDELAKNIAVIGGGSIGLEFGQALARLGINISLYHATSFIGGLTDPKVNAAAVAALSKEFPIYLNEKASLISENNQLFVQAKQKLPIDQIIAAIGRTPNIDSLGLKNIDIPRAENGMPTYDETTMQVHNLPIYLAGDVNQFRPLLHEAADEGRIAAYNAANASKCFQRRTPIRIVFTEPTIAMVGKTFKELNQNPASFVIGEVDYTHQGRAKIKGSNHGLLRVYGAKDTGRLLGAELIAPGGEHLAHLLAWAIHKQLTAFDVLQMPFYHPVIEEGMRTALRELNKQVKEKSSSFDLAMCDSEAIHSLS
ncbi:dihydrolipoyl dehydrogenase [Legionella nagasakiensis]|uniref:dihydrolipoyl dehydrogenase n=1 Tax=Legionella nagasakiensis TaxID=535290 RepID=UPI0013EFBC02|nr:dihydrolipoyl dehydrogenase [Legionella nagasakiensis]